MQVDERDESPGPGEVIVAVAGCGVCHTDLGFYFDGVPTRHPFPLTLGHEIAGRVVEAGPGEEAWLDRNVIVPAVIPCGTCAACRDGRGSICPKQLFPGCDAHGGFGHAVKVPSRGLCPVPDLSDSTVNPHALDLAVLSVVADAVSTPYQAAVRAGVSSGDLAIFVGVGGVGGFGVQVAAALGATVLAIDVKDDRLGRAAKHGAALALNASQLDAKGLRRAVREYAQKQSVPTWRTKIFETSGTTAGQATAFGLLGHGGFLSIVGYTAEPVELRLSNLMAFDATAQGNWGCLPEHYPRILDLVLSGRVVLEPFVERRSLDTINAVFEEVRAGRAERRIVLIPER
jgi:6-hydroxycyclohex-1-ene-1-carbonyl-CoA dehydrogenase